MAQRDWLQEVCNGLTTANIQAPVHGWLHQQQLQATITTKTQDRNSTNHLLLHPWEIKAGHQLTRNYLILFQTYSSQVSLFVFTTISKCALEFHHQIYSHHQEHMPLFLRSFFACKEKKSQFDKKVAFEPKCSI